MSVPNLSGRVDPIVEATIREMGQQIATLTSRLASVESTNVPSLASINKALQIGGSNPLNVTGLVGQLSQPQVAKAQTVSTLPPAQQSNNNQNGTLLIQGGILYVFSTATVPGQWVAVAATGVILEDTHASRVANFPPGSFALGVSFYETDRTVLYINELISGNNTWIYSLGVYSSVIANRPTDLGVNDVGFIFHATDQGMSYTWNGTVWIYRPELGTMFVDTHANRLTFSTSGIPNGVEWFETDRTVTYILKTGAWVYQSGAMIAATGSRPAGLGSGDAGFLFVDSTLNILEYWNGSTWINLTASLTIGGVNAQTSNYTLVSGDNAKLVTMNGSSIAATLPTAATVGAVWLAWIQNLNATALTIHRGLNLLNGGTTDMILQQYQRTLVFTDGSNMFASIPVTAGSGVTLTTSSVAEILSSGGGSSSQVVNALASSNLTLTSSAASIPGTTITLNLAGTWLVRGYVLMRAQFDDNVCTVELNLSSTGIQTGAMAVACPGSTGIIGEFQMAYEWVVVVIGTTTTAVLQALKSGSGGSSAVQSSGTAIVAEWLHP